jgi:hypothetical protein
VKRELEKKELCIEKVEMFVKGNGMLKVEKEFENM